MVLLRFDGNEIGLTEAIIEKEFGRQDIARVFVIRGSISESDIERGETEMFVVDDTNTPDANAFFGGVLKELIRSGPRTEIVIESFELFARDASPLPPDKEFDSADDSAIVQDAIDGVPQLSAGTVETLATDNSIILPNVSRAKQLRLVESASAGEVIYNADKTVDFTDDVGSDRTNITLSPDNDFITEYFVGDKRSGEKDSTHIRMLGGGDGVAQIVSHIIPASDPFDYEADPDFRNVTRYSASHWQPGDREKWGVIPNKDHNNTDMLTNLGLEYAEEFQEPYIEANTVIEDLEVELGDRFSVVYPEEEIDRVLRVVKLSRNIDSTGTNFEVDLSSRKLTIDSSNEEDKKDLDRYNFAFEGSTVNFTTGAGRQSCDAGLPYQLRFIYPGELVFENRLHVEVTGLNLRQVDSGSVSETAALPSDCDVVVNGTSLGTALGDGNAVFTERVDISGLLQPGTENVVEVTTSTPGDIQAAIDGDVYRQINGAG